MTIKNKDEIKKMEVACKMAARALYETGKHVRPGITTNELDKIAYDWCKTNDVIPASLGYGGYPKSICTSPNSVICHGVPDDVPLKEGDIVNLDIAVIKDGFFGDNSAMFYVGKPTERGTKIVEAAKEAMMKGIEAITPNGTTGDIGFATSKYVTRQGFHVVREIGGHGIGRKYHEDPFVPAFGKKGRGDILRPWGTITVEPMVNETAADMIEYDIPGSTVKWYEMADKSLSAQWENTVLITDKGYEILTVY